MKAGYLTGGAEEASPEKRLSRGTAGISEEEVELHIMAVQNLTVHVGFIIVDLLSLYVTGELWRGCGHRCSVGSSRDCVVARIADFGKAIRENEGQNSKTAAFFRTLMR